MQMITDGTSEHGHLVWEQEAEDVDVRAIKKIDKAQAAIDRQTSGESYKPRPGEYFVTELFHPYHGEDDDEPQWQTRTEWIRKQMDL